MRGRRRGTSRLRDFAATAVFLVVAALSAAWLARESDTVVSGRAVIADGDSLEIGGRRIRLEGIDAPEFDQTCTIAQSEMRCGISARDHLRRLTGRQTVRCEGWREDRFERLLAKCSVGAVDLNRMMVLDGWAISYGEYGAEEAQAREAERGLWAGDFMPPRQWRRERLGNAAASADALTAGQVLVWAGRKLDAVRDVVAGAFGSSDAGEE